MTNGKALLLSQATVTSSASAWASDSPVPSAHPVRQGAVTWPEPTHSVLVQQIEAEKAAGQEIGRTLPRPELLQPELDPALPQYIPLNPQDAAIERQKLNETGGVRRSSLH